jgi:outer membrane protein assembly factor BamB
MRALPGKFLRWPLVLLAVSALGAEPADEGSDWPQFLGPTRDCVSPEHGLVEKWDDKGPPLLWEKATGTGYCAPSIRGNRCVLFHREENQEIVSCLDARTGAVQWNYAYPSHFIDPYGYNNGPRGAPLLMADRVFTFGAEGVLTCLELETGKLVWKLETADKWRIPEAFFGVGSSPVLEDGRLLVMIGGQPNSGMAALDPATGAVDFSYWFRSQATDSVNAMSPVVVDDTVLISSAYYKTGSALLKIGDDLKSFTPVWRGLSLEIHWNTPVYHEGFLYAFSGRNEPDAHFRCVEFKTGKVTWDVDERWMGHSTPSPTYGRGSAILADGRLIVTGEAGFLGMYKLNPEKPEEICRCQVPQLQYPCWAGPALSRKRLYLRSEKALVCFNLAPPAAGK